MELWLRSQDKEILILANHLDIYDATLLDDDEETWCIEESGTGIGEYKSKERALEILDEIQNILKSKILKSNGGAYTLSDNNLCIVNPTYETIEQLDTYVYEMPQE